MKTHKKDGLLKREKFRLNVPKVGKFGDGTQPAEFYNKKGEKVPFEKTNICKFLISKLWK